MSILALALHVGFGKVEDWVSIYKGRRGATTLNFIYLIR